MTFVLSESDITRAPPEQVLVVLHSAVNVLTVSAHHRMLRAGGENEMIIMKNRLTKKKKKKAQTCIH